MQSFEWNSDVRAAETGVKVYRTAAPSQDRVFGPLSARVDRLFSAVMVLQAILIVSMAVWVTPRTWAGTSSSVNAHVWFSIAGGLLITSLPIFLTFAAPGRLITRLVMAVSQTLVTGLLIHQAGGRLEMHFHAFVSLAFLAMYLDLRVLLVATLVLATDHLVRGLYWPASVYGITEPTLLRTIEHAIWVVFEDVILAVAILRMRSERIRLVGAVDRISRCASIITGDTATFRNTASLDDLSSIDLGLNAIFDAMTRIQTSFNNISNETNSLMKIASQAVELTEKGVESGGMSCRGINELQQCVQGICGASEEINSVAEQTRLLSLNATIEAARAGQEGAGFGVVARNVKELAVKSGSCSGRITELTTQCTTRVSSSLDRIQTLLENLEEIRATVGSTDDVIGRIRASMSSLAADADRMAMAFSQQDSGRSGRP